MAKKNLTLLLFLFIFSFGQMDRNDSLALHSILSINDIPLSGVNISIENGRIVQLDIDKKWLPYPKK